MTDDWQPMNTAPRDPKVVVRIKLDIKSVRAYWEPEIGCWVLCHPLHIESIWTPEGWKPE
jgi:hypothetical protein